MGSRFLLALALLAGADAYMLAPLRVRPSTMRAAVTVMGVEEAVADCLESGCSIDDVSTLIGELKTKSSSQKDGSLEKVISGFGRSFGTVDAFNFPGEALGYTEKPGSTTTAGKSLDETLLPRE